MIDRQLAVESWILRSCVISFLLVVDICRVLGILADLNQPCPQVVPTAALVNRRLGLVLRRGVRWVKRGLCWLFVEAVAAPAAGMLFILIYLGVCRHSRLRLSFDGSNQLLQHLLVAHEARVSLIGLLRADTGLISSSDSINRRLRRCKYQTL